MNNYESDQLCRSELINDMEKRRSVVTISRKYLSKFSKLLSIRVSSKPPPCPGEPLQILGAQKISILDSVTNLDIFTNHTGSRFRFSILEILTLSYVIKKFLQDEEFAPKQKYRENPLVRRGIPVPSTISHGNTTGMISATLAEAGSESCLSAG